MKYQLYRSSADQQYRWRLIANNNKIIAIGGEGYHNKNDCLAGIQLVKGSSFTRVIDITVPQAINLPSAFNTLRRR